MAETKNPLVSDREVDFQLYDVLDVPSLCRLPYFRDHSRETFDLYLRTARRLAREVLFPTYRAVDEAPPELKDGAVKVHPALHDLFPRLVAMGAVSASKPAEATSPFQKLTITFKAPAQPGPYNAEVEVATSLKDEPPAKFTAYATVVP